MSSTQPGSACAARPKLHRPFVHFDPEAVAVVAILLGVFQVFLAGPLYYLKVGLPMFFMLPLCVGSMFVAAGSFALACERSPSRQLMKGCAYSNLAGLMGALCALCVYSVCVHSPPTFKPCRMDQMHDYDYYENSVCPGDLVTSFFGVLSTLLLVYDIAALVLLSLLSFSALKGLRIN